MISSIQIDTCIALTRMSVCLQAVRLRDMKAFKIILVGPQAVGKSSILNRLIETKFDNNYMSTIGVDFKAYEVNVADQMYAMQIWDTAGQEKFRALTGNYYKGANGCICVFDLSDPSTLEKCEYYIEKAMGEGIPLDCICLVGNKADLGEENKQIGEKFAERFQIAYSCVSAKDGKNINQVFNTLGVKLVNKGEFMPTQNMKLRPAVHISENRSRCSC